MKTDNKTTNKTEYAEMVRGSIDSRILSEAANHTFEKRSSRASTWAAAACFALIFAAAAILLIKPMTERGQAAKGTPSPESTKIAQTTPDASFTPVPTPDISNMGIIYGSADCIAINDVQHKPGTVTLYGGLTEKLADEQYNNCVFAVHIYMDDYYLYYGEKSITIELSNEEIDEPLEIADELNIVLDGGEGEAAELFKARHDAEVQRLKDCGLIAENYEFNGETMLYWLLTRDQLLNFPASPEFAYIITPVSKGEFSCIATEVPQTWYVAADEKEELVVDFFRCIDEERFDDLAKLIAPEERAGYEAIAALAEGSRVGVRNISSVIVKEINPYELTDDMVFAKSLEKYVGIDGARAAYRVKLDMSVYDNTGAFADETGETEQIVLLVKNAEEWCVGFWCLINDDQSSIDKAQVEHIISLLAGYHAAQFTRSAQLGELKLSDNVLLDLEERQRCIDETEERIGQLNYASATVNRLYIAPYYEINGDFKCFTVLYYELVNRNYCSDLQYDFLIRHTVTVAPDGTVLSDIFSEKNTTGFSNTPLGGETLEYYPITSDHYDYLAAANALLAGEAPERTDFYCGQQYVFFRFADDGLMAYDVAYVNDDYEFLFDEPIAVFPREVSELAYRRLNEYYDRYVGDSDHDVGPEPMYQGFVGENWFTLVTLDDSTKDLQAHCIFYFDGNEWREIIASPGLYTDSTDERIPYTIFGACVLGEDNAIICYYSEWIFRAHAQDNNLHIYRTENGGENWSRLDIVLPDHYTDMLFYAPLTPVFDESGINGVIVLQSYLGNGLPAPFAWLESHDGGHAWEFHSFDGNA